MVDLLEPFLLSGGDLRVMRVALELVDACLDRLDVSVLGQRIVGLLLSLIFEDASNAKEEV